MAPRRNGATLAILDAADLIIVVGAADPLGLQRLARGLTELHDAEVSATELGRAQQGPWQRSCRATRRPS